MKLSLVICRDKNIYCDSMLGEIEKAQDTFYNSV